MTPLGELIARLIEETGGIDIGRYLALCLAHPVHGYYTSRDPLGADGDFITAPEISQLFGELIGLSLAQRWLEMGRPNPVLLVELGPGRGTLLADALRAVRIVPGFLEAAELHLVETSPVLRAEQARRLDAHDPHWHTSLQALPAHSPLLLVANEFFDALPVRQFVRHAGHWRERQVGLDTQRRLCLTLSPRTAPLELAYTADPPEGTVLEVAPAREALAEELGRRLAGKGGLALVIDYGGTEPLGDTLQAVRNHQPVDPLAAPGETDLTAHVDFHALAQAAARGGAEAHGPIPQGRFLDQLGLHLRLERLSRAAPGRAADLATAARRLVDASEMGELFKVLALTGSGSPPPPGFPQA